MLGKALVASLVLVPAVAGVASAQFQGFQGCLITEEQVDCRDQGTTARESWTENPANWAQIGAVAASVGGGAFAVVRVRKKRRTLSEFLSAVETAYVAHKGEPGPGIDQLVALRGEVRDLHGRGKLDDGQFLELDKRITDYIARLRRSAIEQTFPDLPEKLSDRIVSMVMDGTVSHADVETARRSAVGSKLPRVDTERLVAILSAWAAQDEGEEIVADAPPADVLVDEAPEEVPDEAWAPPREP